MVRPPRVRVTAGVVPLRREPTDDTERVDEAQYGELLTLLGEDGEWRYAQGPDLYFGWIRVGAITPIDERPRGVVAVPLAAVHAEPRDDARVVDEIPAGTVLDLPDGEWLRAADGWVSAADVVSQAALQRRYPRTADLLASADAFLGVPYLWGGTSARGIDCSGFVQQVYRLNGVGLDRDADQQALGGRAVDEASAGDLLFFGAPSVTHVALATGGRGFVHAPASGRFVERGELSDDHRPVAIRRYLR